MAEQPKNGNGAVPAAPDRGSLMSERTGEQSPGGRNKDYLGVAYGGLGYAMGGVNPENPLAFPGWGRLYTGTYETYRWMLQHPIVQLARSIAVGPMAASTWEYEYVGEPVPEEWITLVREQMDALRLGLMDDFFMQGRDFGFSSGEMIWEVRNGTTVLSRIKHLAHEACEALVDDGGNVIGVRNNRPRKNATQAYVDLATPFKAFHYAYDSYAGYPYGRSWLENIRTTAWADWLSCAQQLEKLGVRLTGIVSIITSPAGTFPGDDGERVSYRDNAIKAIDALGKGATGIWFPSISLNIDESGGVDSMKLIAELAAKSLTHIETKDFGNHSPAIQGLLARMVHDEELMFAGSLRPARSGLSGGQGTGARAESETHTDTGITNAELDDSRFAKGCQPLVDAVLVVNKGPAAAGRVRINPPPLVNRLASTLKAFTLALINDPDVAAEVMDAADTDKIFKILGIPMKRTPSIDNIEKRKSDRDKAAADAKKPPATPDPQGGRPPKEEASAPQITVNVPAQPAPVVNVSVPEQHAPVTHVSLPENRPPAKTVKTIVRDEDGNIVRVTEELSDATSSPE